MPQTPCLSPSFNKQLLKICLLLEKRVFQKRGTRPPPSSLCMKHTTCRFMRQKTPSMLTFPLSLSKGSCRDHGVVPLNRHLGILELIDAPQ